jgi:hypothetical protein
LKKLTIDSLSSKLVVYSMFYNPAALWRWKTWLPEKEIKVSDAKKKMPIRDR